MHSERRAGVTPEEVRLAYRLILGREPESPQVAEEASRGIADLDQLRSLFLNSPEYAAGQSLVGRQLNWPPAKVQVEGTPAQMRQLYQRTADVWKQLGEEEPFWSVATQDEFKMDRFDENEAKFYESGDHVVQTMEAFFARTGEDTGSIRSVLELGCGTGRLTSALARRYPRVTGLDISRPHLDHAAKWMAKTKLDNVELRQTSTIDDFDALGSYDLFFSLIVLQHNPPPILYAILTKLLERVNPGGYAWFQVPTFALGYDFSIPDYLTHGAGGMEMHMVLQRDIYSLFSRLGFDLLEVQEDFWTGIREGVSQTFFAKRRS